MEKIKGKEKKDKKGESGWGREQRRGRKRERRRGRERKREDGRKITFKKLDAGTDGRTHGHSCILCPILCIAFDRQYQPETLGD